VRHGFNARRGSSVHCARHCAIVLQVDPVAGGSATDYDYCNGDPINCTDLTGQWPHLHVPKIVKKAVHVAKAAYQHTVIGLQVCFAVCVGLSFQGGHFTASGGAIGFGGKGGYVGYSKKTACQRQNTSYMVGFAPGIGTSFGTKSYFGKKVSSDAEYDLDFGGGFASGQMTSKTSGC
jgi:hypothetical protein